MVADASLLRLCGSNRKSMELVEASGRNYRKVEVSAESMFSLLQWKLQLLRWKVPSTCTEKPIFMKKIISRFVKLVKIV